MGNSLLRSELKPEFEPDSKASSRKTFLTLDKLKCSHSQHRGDRAPLKSLSYYTVIICMTFYP